MNKMKSKNKIPAQDPSRWNKGRMISIQLLLFHHLPARGMFHMFLEWQCWCVYLYQDYAHAALTYYHPWNLCSVLLPVRGNLHTRSKLSATQILYFSCSIFGSSRLNIKCAYTGLVQMHSAPPGPFCLKLKNWKEEGRLFLLGLWLLVLYLLLLQWLSLLISSVTFPVPSQLTRGMGKVLRKRERELGGNKAWESSPQRRETGWEKEI